MGARRILMVSPEAVPFAKTGGLGDVAGALPLALARLGHDVTLVLPRYRGTDGGTALERLPITVGGRRVRRRVRRARRWPTGRAALLVDCPELFDRAEPVRRRATPTTPTTRVRFALLARAALEFAAARRRAAGRRPRARLAGRTRAGLPRDAVRRATRCWAAPRRSSRFTTSPTRACSRRRGCRRSTSAGTLFSVDGLEFWGTVSFLKAGINFSDLVTTVSPTLRARRSRRRSSASASTASCARRATHLVGILNGIDAERVEPGHGSVPADAASAPDTLEREGARRKRALLEAMRAAGRRARRSRGRSSAWSRGWSIRRGSICSRRSADGLLALDATFVVLGTGEPRYEDDVAVAARPRTRTGSAVHIGFDERLAHLIEAGADIFLMPSRFEPCGLNQMYSLRYGTVPVVRAVGGLDDTVDHWNPRTDAGTGFKFRDYTPEALPGALEQALRPVPRPRGVAGAAAGRDGAGLLLGRVGRRVRQSVREGDRPADGVTDGRLGVNP